MSKNLIIIFGGGSTEHDVSVVTALQIFKKYEIKNINMKLVYIDRENNWYIGEELDSLNFYRNFDSRKLRKVKLEIGSKFLYQEKRSGRAKKLFEIDFVVNCCHGGFGESGDITSLFEMSKIPTSTGDSASLKLAMDKFMTKSLSLALDIPTVDFFTIDKHEWITSREKINEHISQFGCPVVVKPSRQGSSVGVCLVETLSEFEKAVNLAFEFDERIIVERAITKKREFNCCLIKKDERVISASIEESVSENVVISFNDKYLGGGNAKSIKGGTKGVRVRGLGMEGSERKMPADISTKQKNEIIKYAKLMYNALDMCGVVRIDFIMDCENNKIYLGEVNSVPGSLGYYFWGELNVLEILYDSGKTYWKNKFHKRKSTPSAMIFS